MLKKILTVFLMTVVFCSAIPNDAFCSDSQNSQKHHHAIVICHFSCHIIANMSLSSEFTVQGVDALSQNIITTSLIYQNPTRDGILRPPISFL